MGSIKAAALDAEAERRGLGLLRFDYSGHGRSDGRIENGTISRWLEETLAVVRAESEGPQLLLGSSMGGYMALLAGAGAERGRRGRACRGLDPHRAGRRLYRSADLGDGAARGQARDHGGGRVAAAFRLFREPDCFTRDLIEDGRKHLLLGGGMIRIGAPVVVLQGMQDENVPYAHALSLMQRLGDPATLTLIKDGDHRLSRPQDLQLLFEALDRLL